MKKRIAWLLCAAMAVSSLTACGSSSDTAATTAAGAQTEDTKAADTTAAAQAEGEDTYAAVSYTHLIRSKYIAGWTHWVEK